MAMVLGTSSGQQVESDCSARVLIALFILLFPDLLNETDLKQMVCTILQMQE